MSRNSRYPRPRSQRRATAELRTADQVCVDAGRNVRYDPPVRIHTSGVTGKTTTVMHNARATRPARGSAGGVKLETTSWVGQLMKHLRQKV